MEQYQNMLFLVALIVIAYLIIVLPQRRATKMLRQMQSSIKVGDTVATYGGILGIIESIDGDKVIILSGPDKTKIEINRYSIADRQEEM